MTKSSKSYLKASLILTYGILVFLFWAICHPSLLSYQEQLQLFQLTDSYFYEHLSWPGGLSTYIGEFMCQFYNNYWIGGLILGLIFSGMWALTWSICKRLGGNSFYIFLLSLIPCLMMLMYMGNINVMPSFLVSILITLIFTLTYYKFMSIIERNKILKTLSLIFCLPVFYWLFGPVVFLLALLISVHVLFSKNYSWTLKLLFCLLIFSYTLSCVLMLSLLVLYPTNLQFVGINYYRDPTTFPLMEFVVEFGFTLTLLLAGVSSKMPKKISIISWSTIVIGLVAIGLFWGNFYVPMTLELIEYDYLVRINDWKGVLNKAEKKQPNLPMSVCATNLALGMTNQLGDRAFHFYQNGTEGLLPPFQREFNSLLVTAEAYFQLGLTNTAQRFYFEAMEGIPNYNKSVRCIKRLTETNMLNGHYEVAKKYLRILKNTSCYAKWAYRTEQLIDNQTIDKHPLYSKLRRSHLENDFLFSEEEIDKVLGQLFLKNPNNALAKQYLLFHPMLERNLPKLMQYLQVVQERVPYNPILCQQGIAFASMQNHQEIPENLVGPGLIDHLRHFAQTMTEKGKDSPAMDQFRGTLWHYLTINP